MTFYFNPMRKYVIALVILGLLAGYFYTSRQRKLVINDKGKIEGLGNRCRALVQRNNFWEGQLKLASDLYNKSIEPHKPSSADIQELYKKYRQAEDALNERMNDLYTPDERLAEKYRIKADSVLRAAKWRLGDEETEAARMKETASYKAIVEAIEKRIKN